MPCDRDAAKGRGSTSSAAVAELGTPRASATGVSETIVLVPLLVLTTAGVGDAADVSETAALAYVHPDAASFLDACFSAFASLRSVATTDLACLLASAAALEVALATLETTLPTRVDCNETQRHEHTHKRLCAPGKQRYRTQTSAI